MAYDRYEIEHHLTPTGWKAGSESDQSSHSSVIPPADRIETWLYKMRQSSGWSPEDVKWDRIWVHPEMTEAQRTAIRDSFPSPFKRPSGDIASVLSRLLVTEEPPRIEHKK